MSTDAQPTPSDDRPANELTYREAVVELEQILTQLDDEEIDVDVLTERVRRATALISTCRDRLAGAQVEIESILGDANE